MPIADVGPWSEEKYRLIQYYSQMFATSMKKSWECRVYIDLFSGPGYSRIRGTSKIVYASPLLALDISDPFDRYIFSDIDLDYIEALEKRVQRDYPSAKAVFLHCDVNESIDLILSNIPKPSKSFRVLTFCLVDPYNIGSLHLSTLSDISRKFYVDFFVLIPSRMDAHRFQSTYLKADNPAMDRFLDDIDWRNKWDLAQKEGMIFWNFVLQQFNERMLSIGFLKLDGDEFVPIYETGTQRLLYHLAVYSRRDLGKQFWRETIKRSDPQQSLFK